MRCDLVRTSALALAFVGSGGLAAAQQPPPPNVSPPANAAFVNGALAVPGGPANTDTVPAKFSARARAFGSRSIRRTCRARLFPCRRVPRAAWANSSSSGVLLHRKYDSRVASSKSLSNRGPEPASSSTLNRKCGDARTACSASRSPGSVPAPAFWHSSTKRISRASSV